MNCAAQGWHLPHMHSLKCVGITKRTTEKRRFVPFIQQNSNAVQAYVYSPAVRQRLKKTIAQFLYIFHPIKVT